MEQTEIPWTDFEKAMRKLGSLPADGITAQKMEALKAIVGTLFDLCKLVIICAYDVSIDAWATAVKSGVEVHVPMAQLAKAVSWFGPIGTLLESVRFLSDLSLLYYMFCA